MSTHYTHELRHRVPNPNKPYDTETHLHVRGSEEDCYKYLRTVADNHGCGIGLLLSNCGWSVVCLQEELVQKTKDAAPKLLEILTKLHRVVMQSDDRKILDNGENSHIVAEAFDIIKQLTKQP